MKLGVLCSGQLGNIILQKLFKEYEIKFVFTDGKSLEIIDFCINQKIVYFSGNPREGRATSFIKSERLKKSVDLLISVNYLFIIEKSIIELSKDISFNIHGSLLPKYRGRTPHVWSIINNEKFAGITAHLIDEGCDTGDVIKQVAIPIEDDDTGYSMLKKFEKEYYPLILSILNDVKNGCLTTYQQDHTKGSYFGKRTPNDGMINWEWQKERIRNWVRAQAYPYPGAFTFINGNKLIIDEIVFVEEFYEQGQDNGLILSKSPFIVKCCNGCIKITKFRINSEKFIQEGNLLGNENSKL